MMGGQSLKTGLMVTGMVVLATIFGVLTANYQQNKAQPDIQGLLWPDPKTLAPFTAVDHESNPFTLTDLLGKWSFLFFGFTHCPDICPVTLAAMDKVHRQLEQPQNVQTVFISVDPERDTPGRLDKYVTNFNPEFIGLGGSVEQVAGLTGQIGLPYFLDKSESEENYLVDHGSSLFLIDPRGRLVAIFSTPHDNRNITDRFNRIRQFIDG